MLLNISIRKKFVNFSITVTNPLKGICTWARKRFILLKILKSLMENLVKNNTTVGFFRFINFFKSYNTIYIYMYIFSENSTIYIGIYAIITFDKFHKSKKTYCSVVKKMLRMIYFEF